MIQNPLKRILVVDDEPMIVSLLSTVLREKGWDVIEARSGTDGIDQLDRGRFDVILTDLVMPGDSGIDLLRAAKEIHPDVEVILMTGYANADTAIEAMRNGAFHYIMKPLKTEEVLHLVEKAYSQRQLQRENQFLKSEIRAAHHVQSVVGDSAAIERADRHPPGDRGRGQPVLLVGERGHRPQLLRADRPLLQPPVRGSCSSRSTAGASRKRRSRGPVRDARGPRGDRPPDHSGKIEICEPRDALPRRLRRGGAGGPRPVDRVISEQDDGAGRRNGTDPAGHPPHRLVQRGPRGGAGPAGERSAGAAQTLEPGIVRIPALRERNEDVPLLLHHFLEEANQERKKPLKGFTPAALSVLEPYDWPGNVRELRDLVRAISSKKKQGTMIDASDIPPEILYRQLRRSIPRSSRTARQGGDR